MQLATHRTQSVDRLFPYLDTAENLPMRIKHLTCLATLSLTFLATEASADILIRRNGSSWARVDDDGTIRIKGRSVGSFESNGTVRRGGSSIGTIESNGTIRRQGSSVGRVHTDGTIRRRGSSIGRIESGGSIRRNGSSWGSASSCCGSFGGKKAVTAVLVFFADDFFD